MPDPPSDEEIAAALDATEAGADAKADAVNGPGEELARD